LKKPKRKASSRERKREGGEFNEGKEEQTIFQGKKQRGKISSSGKPERKKKRRPEQKEKYEPALKKKRIVNKEGKQGGAHGEVVKGERSRIEVKRKAEETSQKKNEQT